MLKWYFHFIIRKILERYFYTKKIKYKEVSYIFSKIQQVTNNYCETNIIKEINLQIEINKVIFYIQFMDG